MDSSKKSEQIDPVWRTEITDGPGKGLEITLHAPSREEAVRMALARLGANGPETTTASINADLVEHGCIPPWDAEKRGDIVGYIVRERFMVEGPRGSEFFFSRGTGRSEPIEPGDDPDRPGAGGKETEGVEAIPENDVCIPIRSDGEGMSPNPPCPDCGGRIEYAEAGGVPGSRECADCGSRFQDSRWGADFLEHVCALNSGGRTGEGRDRR